MVVLADERIATLGDVTAPADMPVRRGVREMLGVLPASQATPRRPIPVLRGTLLILAD